MVHFVLCSFEQEIVSQSRDCLGPQRGLPYFVLYNANKFNFLKDKLFVKFVC